MARDIRAGKTEVQSLEGEIKELYQLYAQGRQLAADRDFLGISAHSKVREEIVKVQMAYRRLEASGKLTGAELAQASEKAGNRIRELEKSTSAAAGSLKGVSSAGKQAGEQISAGMNRAKNSSGAFEKSVSSINSTLNQVKGAALGFFGLQGATNAISSLSKLADQYNSLNAKIKLATGEGEAFESAQAGIIDIATRTGTALSATADLYTKIAGSSKELGLTQQQQLQITEAVSQSFQVSGTSAAAASGAVMQFGQALASGVLRGDEFNSVMEAAPRLAQALADGLDVPRGALRKMAEEGELTAERVTAALLSQKDVISSEFSTLPKTINQSLENLNTQWTLFVGNLDKSTGASVAAAGALDAVANNLDDIASAAKIAGEVALVAMAIKASGAVRGLIADMVAAKAAAVGIGDGMTAGAARGAAAITRLRGLLVAAKGLLTSIGVPVVITFVYESVTRAFEAIRKLRREQEAVGDSWGRQAEQMRLFYEQLDNINRQLGTNFQTMDEWNAAVADGTVVVDEANNRWALAADYNAKLNEEIGRVTTRFYENTKAVEALSTAFDSAAEGGKGVEDAILAIADSAASGESGLFAAAGALEIIGERSKESAKTLRDDLGGALQKLTAEEFEAFAQAAQRAFERAGNASTNVAGIMQNVVGEAARRLGLDAEKIGGGFTKSGQEAVSALRVLAETGNLTGKQLLEAVGGALKNAKTADDVRAIEVELKNLAASGFLVGAEVAAGQVQVKAAMAAVSDGAGDVVQKMVQQADAAAAVTAELQNQRLAQQGVADQVSATGEAAAGAVREASDAITSSGQSWFLGIINDYTAALEQFSKKAGEEFRRSFGQEIPDQIDLSKLSIEEVNRLLAETAGKISAARNEQGRYNDDLSEWAIKQKLAFLEIQQETLGQVAKMKRLAEAAQEGALSVEDLEYWSRNAARSFDLLDDRQMDSLISAIDEARQKFKDLSDDIREETRSLQDELDELQGNRDEIERREFEQRRKELEEKLAAARQSGDRDLIREAEKALELLKQIEQERARQRQEEEKAEAEREAERARREAERATEDRPPEPEKPERQRDPEPYRLPDPPRSSRVTLRFESPSGRAAEAEITESMVQELLRVLREAGAVVIAGDS
jgi:tape measure domain-containing protein